MVNEYWSGMTRHWSLTFAPFAEWIETISLNSLDPPRKYHSQFEKRCTRGMERRLRYLRNETIPERLSPANRGIQKRQALPQTNARLRSPILIREASEAIDPSRPRFNTKTVGVRSGWSREGREGGRGLAKGSRLAGTIGRQPRLSFCTVSAIRMAAPRTAITQLFTR